MSKPQFSFRRAAVSLVVLSGALMTATARPLLSFQGPGGSGYVKTVNEEKLAQLKAHAEKMKEQDRGRTYSEIARALAEIANQQFADGHPEQAQASIKEAVSYSEKAASAAKQHNKKIKDTEINLRECARRLDETRRAVTVDEQAAVKEAIVRIDQLRKELLDHMFRRN